jgi:hypothetical protein
MPRSAITVRDLAPRDKLWLQREARRLGVSMEEFVRQLIRDRREKQESREKPSETVARIFGPEHGVELPPRRAYGFRTIEFDEE